ncbi:hypothetical protein IQ251_04180 [Saccharopolyspora sp. HNM0983]|uniref:Uncharacterized protein n=1 Tax=Saccharopolyspora montiporae TaxID=2781240 RepID=A0A929G0I6_9PSEU|nr:hypothetical protein [Saccharopolyspora sp. HNM0983]MBE9373643.1 hypothetical protein [Saccharopolyspora sp. HNM0983]
MAPRSAGGHGLAGFEVAVGGAGDVDPDAYRWDWATWWLVQFPEVSTGDEVAAAIDRSG